MGMEGCGGAKVAGQERRPCRGESRKGGIVAGERKTAIHVRFRFGEKSRSPTGKVRKDDLQRKREADLHIAVFRAVHAGRETQLFQSGSLGTIFFLHLPSL